MFPHYLDFWLYFNLIFHLKLVFVEVFLHFFQIYNIIAVYFIILIISIMKIVHEIQCGPLILEPPWQHTAAAASELPENELDTAQNTRPSHSSRWVPSFVGQSVIGQNVQITGMAKYWGLCLTIWVLLNIIQINISPSCTGYFTFVFLNFAPSVMPNWWSWELVRWSD